MMRQLELFGPQDLSHDNTSACAAEISEHPEIHMPLHLAEELEAAAERVRAGLNKMRATHAEIGRELWAVEKRSTRGQFMSWVGFACGLSRWSARLMMRYAALAALRSIKTPIAAQLKARARCPEGHDPHRGGPDCHESGKTDACVRRGGEGPAPADGKSCHPSAQGRDRRTEMTAFFTLPHDFLRVRAAVVDLGEGDDPRFIAPLIFGEMDGLQWRRVAPGGELERPTLPIPWIVIVDDRSSGAAGPSSFRADTLKWLFADAFQIAIDAAEPHMGLYEYFVEEGLKRKRILIVHTVESRRVVWREFSRENCDLYGVPGAHTPRRQPEPACFAKGDALRGAA
jgi:hypothetical protein